MPKPPRAVVYARLSRNRTGERSASTARQERDCRALSGQRGWDVVEVEVDDDRSAYSGKPRPGYDRMMAAVAAGQVDVIVAWAPDRLHRSPVELETFIDTVDRAGVEVATVQAGRVDLATPAGRMQARMLGNVARYESEHRSARTSAAHAQIAAEGRWKGGRRPYGYRPQPGGTMDVDPAEAAIVREVHQRLMDGQRPGSIASDLNRRGVATVTGAAWTIPTVRNMVQSLTLAGRRIWKGQDVGPGQWPPILTVADVMAAQARLGSGPSRKASPRVSLLTGGRVRCSSCDLPMRTHRRDTGIRVYRCLGCFRQIVGDQLDEYAGDLVLEQMRRTDPPDVTEAEVDDAAIAQLEAKRVKATEAWTAGLLTDDLWNATLADVNRRLEAARGPVRLPSLVTDRLVGPDGEAHWKGLDLASRQAAFDSQFTHLVVGPGGRGRGFGEGRVVPVPVVR